ncbi:MAG: DUF1646 family protein [Chloroflexota bacterium]
MPQPDVLDAVLFGIFLLVLILPFKVKIVEHNLEIFLFVMGALAVTVTSKWGMELILEAAEEPVLKGIVPAVLIAGLLFHYGRAAFQRSVNALLKSVPTGAFVFAVLVVLGLLSSVITAIIASLLLVEIVTLMPMTRPQKINLVIIACFAIGLGAVLTPLGEPLSTIAISKLQGPPYEAGFWYLFDQLAVLIVPGVIACALFAMFWTTRGGASMPVTGGVGSGTGTTAAALTAEGEADDGGLREVIVRTIKVYAFVSALFLLGAGMESIINKYFTQLPAAILFWLNMVSAILDNATLTAAEIAPSMSQVQINAALMGLLISGGMLIPGNIPNIISAGKLGITSGEWAKLGVPFGLVLNAIYFVVVFILGFSPRLGI